MKRLLWFCWAGAALGQEAGFEMPVTVSSGMLFGNRVQSARGSRMATGMRAVAYPTLRLSRRWFVSGAIQATMRPYFAEQLSTQGWGVRGDALQAYVGYSLSGDRKSLTIRAGQLTSAFGSFLLRYDDAANPLVDMPAPYGYYYKAISTLGLMGAQVDASVGRVDMRAQFTTSSPSNRRGTLDHDRYGNWTGGMGWTIRQGYRVGVSAFRGPYLHQGHRYMLPGEKPASTLPAGGLGLDVQIARGHWSFQGEAMRIQRAYTVFPTYSQLLVYGEARYTISPRIFAAFRAGHEEANLSPDRQVYEAALGFRPSASTLLKAGYQATAGAASRGARDNVFLVQFVQKLAGPSSVF